jgi:hypothetical protein
MDITQTASAKSALQTTGSDVITVEQFANVLARGLDEVFKRDFDHPKQAERYFRPDTTKFETKTFRSWRMMDGQVGVNRDADDIPFGVRGEGFNFALQTYNYRKGMQVEKTALETGEFGVARGFQADLADNAERAVELSGADVFNRAVSPTNAPILADDGMYLIDEDRPNANPKAAAWSNQEAASAITETSLFTAGVNARAMTDENGELSPTMIKKYVIRPTDEMAMKQVLMSTLGPSNALNAVNTMKGSAPYEIYDYLTDAAIFYLLGDPKSDKNELGMYWRVRREFETWKGADNPDVIKQRVRMAFGYALGSPRKMWRGGEVS